MGTGCLLIWQPLQVIVVTFTRLRRIKTTPVGNGSTDELQTDYHEWGSGQESISPGRILYFFVFDSGLEVVQFNTVTVDVSYT